MCLFSGDKFLLVNDLAYGFIDLTAEDYVGYIFESIFNPVSFYALYRVLAMALFGYSYFY